MENQLLKEKSGKTSASPTGSRMTPQSSGYLGKLVIVSATAVLLCSCLGMGGLGGMNGMIGGGASQQANPYAAPLSGPGVSNASRNTQGASSGPRLRSETGNSSDSYWDQVSFGNAENGFDNGHDGSARFGSNRRYSSRQGAEGIPGLNPLPAPLSQVFFRPINQNTWRTRIPASSLYPIVLRHLSESYVIRTNDPRNMSIQTDWDKFFIGGRLFRNRMNISLFQLAGLDCEMIINNKVEYFQASEESSAYGESDWIPTQDVTNEKKQLVEALTRILHAMNVASRAP
jgi:hypothetical protein